MSTSTDIGTGRDSAPTQRFANVPEALKALAAAVAEAQQAGPLQPVTVIAPSRVSALDITHFLGRTLNHGRPPLSQMLREGAVTAVLAEAPGQIAAVADQPATARARGQRTDSDILPCLRSRSLEEEPWLSM